MTDVRAYLADKKELVDSVLIKSLPPAVRSAGKVREAMEYAVFSDGKRLRPVLMLAVAELMGRDEKEILTAASAIEFIHTCSLILDDLPSMDDSKTRRGKPALHVAYDESTAILAAEALLLHAFELIVQNARQLGLSAEKTASAVSAAAGAGGYPGMVSGQYLDLQTKDSSPSREDVESVHLRKTGALFIAAARIAAVLCLAPPEEEESLARYGSSLGLAFQITDDLLDARAGVGGGPVEGLNYALLFGVETARERADSLIADALDALGTLGDRAEILAALARFVRERGV